MFCVKLEIQMWLMTAKYTWIYNVKLSTSCITVTSHVPMCALVTGNHEADPEYVSHLDWDCFPCVLCVRLGPLGAFASPPAYL